MLVPGNGDADARDPERFGEVVQRPTPPAADIEHLHAGLKPQFARDQIELVFLRFVEPCGVFPIGAAVDHALVQHRAEQVLTEIVVALADLKRACLALEIHQPGLHTVEGIGERPDTPINTGAIGAAGHFVNLLALPPGVHIAFADPQHAVGEDSGIEFFVTDLDVPGAVTVNADIAGCQDRLQSFSIALRSHVVVIESKSARM